MDGPDQRLRETLVSDAEHLWTVAARLLQEQVSETVWLSTFQDAKAVELTADQLVLAVPSTHEGTREAISRR